MMPVAPACMCMFPSPTCFAVTPPALSWMVRAGRFPPDPDVRGSHSIDRDEIQDVLVGLDGDLAVADQFWSRSMAA